MILHKIYFAVQLNEQRIKNSRKPVTVKVIELGGTISLRL